MPLPAGTGLTRRELRLARRPGSRSPSTAAAALATSRSRTGSPRRPRAPANQNVLVSVFLDGGIDALSVLFPAGDPAYYSLRPTARARRRPRARRSPRTRGCAGTRPRAGSRRCTARARSRSSRRSATTTPTSRTSPSRHYWEVGATDASLRTGWLGRYLDHVGTPDNPLQGLTLDTRCSRRSRPRRCRWRRSRAADQYTFAPPGVADAPARGVDVRGGGAHRRRARESRRDAGLAQAGKAALDAHQLCLQPRRLRTVQEPGRLPALERPVPDRLAGLAAMLGAGLPLRVVATRPRRRTTTRTPNQATTLQRVCSSRRLAARLPARPRGARDRRPRARPRLVGVRPPRRRRTARPAPTTAPAGIGFLIGTRVKGQQVGEFPGVARRPRRAGQPHGRPRDFRAVYAALLEQWLDADANAIIPGGAAFPRPALLK